MTTLRKFYTTKDIAELCGVHITTAIRWIDAGQIKAFRTPGGRRRVAADEVRAFIEKHKIPVGRKLRREQALVLIVDDDAASVKAMSKQLTAGERSEVVTASSGYDALVTVGTAMPDAVVLDLGLTHGDGLELLASIKRNPTTSHVVVLAVSNKLTPAVSRKATELGAFAVLAKADAIPKIASLVESALH